MGARPGEILVLKPSSLGDVVHTLPAVRRLKRAQPDTCIRWVVNPEWAPLLHGNPDLEEVIEFPRGQFRGLGWTLPFWRWARGLRRCEPALALDFQGLFRTGVMARASGAGRILCLSNAELLNRLMANEVVPMRRDEHAVDRYLRLVTALGVADTGPVEFPMPAGDPVAEMPARFVLLHPFSRGVGKSLTPEQASAFCRALGDLPVVLAGRTGIPLSALPANAHNLLNCTSLAQLIWLIRRAAFVVSVDSGPMHIAAALTPRLLSIHTWSDPRLVGPYEPAARIWKAGRIVHRAEVDAALASRSQPLADRDVEQMARFVRCELDQNEVNPP